MIPDLPSGPGIDDVSSMVALFNLANLELLCSVLVLEKSALFVTLMASTGGLVQGSDRGLCFWHVLGLSLYLLSFQLRPYFHFVLLLPCTFGFVFTLS